MNLNDDGKPLTILFHIIDECRTRKEYMKELPGCTGYAGQMGPRVEILFVISTQGQL